jgi:hypothetical protein
VRLLTPNANQFKVENFHLELSKNVAVLFDRANIRRMMRLNLRNYVGFLFGLLLVFPVACGGDSSSTVKDASSDGKADAGNAPDSGVPTQDSGLQVDTGSGALDAQPVVLDGAVVDGAVDVKLGSDALPDAAIDHGSAPDGGTDGHVVDVGGDGGADAKVPDAPVTIVDTGAQDDAAPAIDGSEGTEGEAGTSDNVDAQIQPAIRVLNMHMEESAWAGVAGEVKDSSGAANNGTAVGSATTTADGKFGRAGLFDGTTASVTIPDAPSLHASTVLTLSAWIYPTGIVASDTVAAQGIISKRDGYGNSSAFSMFISGGKLNVDIQTEDNRFTSNTVFENNRWYHVAVVFDGNLPAEQRVSVYVNGVLDITAKEDSSSIAPYTPNLVIGLLPNGGSHFAGRIDEVGMWTRALSAAEITSLYTNSADL